MASSAFRARPRYRACAACDLLVRVEDEELFDWGGDVSDPRATALFKMVAGERTGHGGRRAGAGRKKTGRRVGGPHRRRPELEARHPVHVTMRMRRWMPELRTRDVYRVIHATMARFLGRDDVRFVHASVQRTHLHLLVEAADRVALTRGMQSFAIRLARALRGGGNGKVFAYRYHAVQITTARQARSALAYVLNNWRRHREMASIDAPVDPYASGVTFDGWSERPRFRIPAGYVPLPTSPPRTALLAWQWRRHGRIDPFERPGPSWG